MSGRSASMKGPHSLRPGSSARGGGGALLASWHPESMEREKQGPLTDISCGYQYDQKKI